VSPDTMPKCLEEDFKNSIEKLICFLTEAGVNQDEIDKKRNELKEKSDTQKVAALAKFLSATNKRNAIAMLVEQLKKDGVKEEEIDKKRRELERKPQNAIVRELREILIGAHKRNALEAANLAPDDLPPPAYACHYPAGDGTNTCSDLPQLQCNAINYSRWHGPGMISPTDQGHNCPI
jgi:nitrate reductase cytochrome c-type subunit